MAVSANRLELLQIADAVAREKSIDREIVIEAMADAIQKAARSKYGQETNIRVDINTKTGEMKLQRLLEVVEEVEDPNTQIYLDLARDKNPEAERRDVKHLHCRATIGRRQFSDQSRCVDPRRLFARGIGDGAEKVDC